MDQEPQGGQAMPSAAEEDMATASVDTSAFVAAPGSVAAPGDVAAPGSVAAPEIVTEPPPARWTPLPEQTHPAPRFTVRALVTDTFARYGADPIRLAVVSANLTIVSLVLGLLLQGSGGRGLYDLLNAINGAVSTSLLLAVAGGGPSMAPRAVLVRGLRRSPRVLITLWAVVISASIVSGVIAFAARLFLHGTAYDAVIVVAVLAAIWVVLRLVPAFPAVVTDQQGVAEGLSMARSVTASSGVWARIGVVALLLGALFVASFIGVGALATLALRFDAVLWIVIAFQTLWAPVAALFVYSAYRRLVVPGGMEAAWAEPQVPLDVPPFGRAGRAILIGAVAFAAVGLATFVIAAAR